MALQLHRLFATSYLHEKLSSPSRLLFMSQYRGLQNYPSTCMPCSPFGDGYKYGKLVQIKFRMAREPLRIATDRLKELSFKFKRDSFLLGSVTDGCRHEAPVTFQSYLRDGFPYTMKARNIFSNRCLDGNFRLSSSSRQCAVRRFSSVHAKQKAHLSRTTTNRNDNVSGGDAKFRGKQFYFKHIHRFQKQAKPFAVCSSGSNGGVEVGVSSKPVKKRSSSAKKLAVKTTDMVNLKEELSGDGIKEGASESSVSTSVKSDSNNPQTRTKGKKKQQLASKKDDGQFSGTNLSSGVAQSKGSKSASQIKKSNAKALQSSQASEILPVGETPLAENTSSTDNLSKKTTKNSTGRDKPEKKGRVVKSSKALSEKSKSAQKISSSTELPQAQKMEGKIKSYARTFRPLHPPTGKSVVVVESVTKAKVIQDYLGHMFEVLPSYGHVRDLAGRSGSVRPDDDFSMVWEVPSAAWTHLKSIKVALNGAENLILASDPDREGEAIAWHITEMLQQQGALHGDITVARVVFHEITELSIKSALQAPRDIDANLVHAYLARRALDYLIGFSISPLLWRKLPACQSAGRVQSAALSLICDREMEIEEFKPQEYWTVEVEFNKRELGSLENVSSFSSHLTYFDLKKLGQLSIGSFAEAKLIEQKITSSTFEVLRSKRSKMRKNPPPPYITSTLQQDAANKFCFTATYTMKLAQKLYEGVKLSNDEATGLITYMRTDGLNVSNEAAKDIQALVRERYGQGFASEITRVYFKKVKNAQEAHEAIRPTDIWRLPSKLAGVLDEDSLKLYTLIWARAMACQMEPTVIDQIQIDIGTADESIVLRSTCSRVEFPGYQAVYKDEETAIITRNEDGNGDDARNEAFKALCSLKSGDPLHHVKVGLMQHFTQPPPRYSEGSLVKKLEELGIGRPSTYATTLKVLQDRSYVTVKSRVLYPEFRGRMVSAFLSHYFSEVTDYNFTADMETELDNVSVGVTEWKGLLKDYWTRFSMYCDRAANVSTRQVEKMLEEKFGDFLFSSPPDKSRECPSCLTGTLVFKVSRFGEGYFIGCDQHPKCKYIAKMIYGDDEEEVTPQKQDMFAEPKLLGLNPGSNEKVLLKNGPYGFYVQLGEDRKGYVPKRASVSQIKDVESITLEHALELLRYPVLLGNHPDDDQPVYLRLARFGFSIKHRRTIAPVPKNTNPKDITLEKALKFLLSKDAKRCGRPKSKPKVEEAVEAI
ncbi:PREDICTED: uncharacterized protein LOC104597850 [Nelumbo nucifera]|uniref:DNA topoisomerase n=2 Tax=Nelumbo nucifera TaxID=4432 RepID=A0A822YKX7_NELNU|nr:PREDICTED: uncharacterized protein LOC104597850 [Nelumbo nucifera]DAD31566.1 TPA_asm: hypothetical protein HUJ06_010417 [Nelumbo nucifera]